MVHEALTANPRFRELCLIDAWTHPRPTHIRSYSLIQLLRAAAMRMQGCVYEWLGGDPVSLFCYYRFPRKWGFVPARGAVIAELYRRRGLPSKDS